jgi:nucleoside-diphosphate-sugar epimerase
MRTVVIFGGTGFIGIHYARKVLAEKRADMIVLADVKDILPQFMFADIARALADGKIRYERCDVRDAASFAGLPASGVGLVANFAAIHREPGHEHHEYYQTNIPGAENVCAYAERAECDSIVFTSSIAVYEPTELPKGESTVPAPISAYGGSKLAAELIHRNWQERDPERRKLVIVRPGVVYGPGEGGNVTRMIKMIKKGFFVYVGNKKTRKASIYVKELIAIIDHLLLAVPAKYVLANAVVPVPPSMEEYVAATKAASGWKRWVPNMPYGIVLVMSVFVAGIMGLFGKKSSINPVRVRKLRRINNIVTEILPSVHYTYAYDLQSAFRDWFEDYSADW